MRVNFPVLLLLSRTGIGSYQDVLVPQHGLLLLANKSIAFRVVVIGWVQEHLLCTLRLVRHIGTLNWLSLVFNVLIRHLLHDSGVAYLVVARARPIVSQTFH